MLLEKLKGFLQKNLFGSFKATINTFYITIIIILVSITGGVSYYLATQQVEENAYRNINDTVQQTTNYLELIYSDVFEQLVSLSNDPQITSLIYHKGEDISPKTYTEIDDTFKSIYNRNSPFIESIYFDLDGYFTVYKGSQQQLDPDASYDDYFETYTGSKESFYWRNVHENDFFVNEEEVMSVFKLIGNTESETQGILLFNLNPDMIERAFSNLDIGENGYLTIRSSDGHFALKELDDPYQLDESSKVFLKETEETSGTFSFTNDAGEDMTAVYNTVGVNDWKVVAVVPESELMNKVNYIKIFIICFIMFIILTGMFLINIVGKFISKPVIELADKMETVDETHRDITTTSFVVPQELQVVHQSFNNLMLRNQVLLDKIKDQQKEVRQLEVGIIQAQMKPHFLYNTLYSIKGLCDMADNRGASEMVSALASYYRTSISKGEEIIMISDEIENIKSYLFIMDMRYGDQFTYNIQVEDKLLSYDIIKLTLQPIIENAIYHGVKEKRGQSKITLDIFQVDENIHLVIADDGIGIGVEKVSKIQEVLNAPYEDSNRQMIGIGLKSVHERIKNHFGDQYGLHIESTVGMGTKVIIKIPKLKGRHSKDVSDYDR
ncbi:MAG TPA: sensor histidine kinase [Virgibacillus sp.]|nr:sensor histidine kinase [Virgibacillus sp.]